MVWCVLNESKCETMKTLISQYDDDDGDDDNDDNYKIDFSKMIWRTAFKVCCDPSKNPFGKTPLFGWNYII